MIISHLLRRSFTTFSNVIRTNVDNAKYKRLLVKKFDHLLHSEKRYSSAYDGDGRTVGFVINKKNAEVLLLSAVTKEGFILTQGPELVGSLIIFPHSIMNWNVLSAAEVSEESLCLFKILDPKIDILIFGYGSPKAYTPEIRDNFQKICKKLQIKFEAMPTETAIGVYNFLADERRLVAAALIPPVEFSPFRFDEGSDITSLDDFEEEKPTLIGDKNKEGKLIN